MTTGSVGSGAYSSNAFGTVAPSTTGYTNICEPMSSWKLRESMKSTNCLAPASLRAPASTPAYSTCWKQSASMLAVGGGACGSSANMTSAAGLVE